MGQTSGIEWTEATWNPWHGCRKVSPGCAHCYMYRDKRRYGQDPTLVVKSKTSFDAPKKWKESKMIFTCSWSDFFIEEADEWRAEAWDVIRDTPQHTYQILTKRPERISDHLPPGWPLSNVWLGVSVENPRFYHRIEAIKVLPASVRFLSLEPLLAPMPSLPLEGISWVVVGGESGPGCRPMKPEWVREIREQCKKAEVAFFFKQWGGARKDIAGRKLDGRTWNAMPQGLSNKKTPTKKRLSEFVPLSVWS
jgi:protein gp37